MLGRLVFVFMATARVQKCTARVDQNALAPKRRTAITSSSSEDRPGVLSTCPSCQPAQARRADTLMRRNGRVVPTNRRIPNSALSSDASLLPGSNHSEVDATVVRKCGANGDFAMGDWLHEASAPYPYPDSRRGGYIKREGLDGADAPWKFKWVPHGCLLDTFSPDSFCKALGGRSLVFAGDSISSEFITSVHHLFEKNGAKPGQCSSFGPKDRGNLGDCFTVCNCSSAIAYIPNANLILNNASNSPECIDSNRCTPWATRKVFSNFDIVVLNAGAHTPTNNGPVFDRVINFLQNDVVQWKLETKPLVVWRTTLPAHLSCDNITRPIPLEQAGKMMQHPTYAWESFSGQNQIAKKRFSEVGAVILDGFPILATRPDAHMARHGTAHVAHDCLHWTLPGPIDTLTIALQNVLQYNPLSRSHLARVRPRNTCA